MQVTIRDRKALAAVSPAALSAYARTAGWRRDEPYRAHSDVYVGEDRPEIIVPRTERLGDYASVVAALIGTFAEVAERDELTVYRSLVSADRDVVRVTAGESADGSVALNDGADLIDGTRELLRAVACSLGKPRAVHPRPGANREATDLVKGIRLGQTDQGSYVITLLTEVVAPPMPTLFPDSDELGDSDAPPHRRLARRLIEAVTSARQAAERAVAGDAEAFADTIEHGVSANLCEALVKMIEPFPALDVDVLWARTRPVKQPPSVVRFGPSDAPLLKGAALAFRERAPRLDVQLVGHVRLLKRAEAEEDGTIRLATSSIDDRPKSVTALLEREDYERALEAHKHRAAVVLSGDLERLGQGWRLLSPVLREVVRDEEMGFNDD